MRKQPLILVVLCGLLLVPASSAIAQAPDADATARVIVKYRAESSLLRKRMLSAAAQHAGQAEALGHC